METATFVLIAIVGLLLVGSLIWWAFVVRKPTDYHYQFNNIQASLNAILTLLRTPAPVPGLKSVLENSEYLESSLSKSLEVLKKLEERNSFLKTAMFAKAYGYEVPAASPFEKTMREIDSLRIESLTSLSSEVKNLKEQVDNRKRLAEEHVYKVHSLNAMLQDVKEHNAKQREEIKALKERPNGLFDTTNELFVVSRALRYYMASIPTSNDFKPANECLSKVLKQVKHLSDGISTNP